MKATVIFVIIMAFICLPDFAYPDPGNMISYKKTSENKIFSFYCTDKDIGSVFDIESMLLNHYTRICNFLEYPYKFNITVEVYPDQKSYNLNLMDKRVTGSPACSGNRRIQMVSPASPIRVEGISYKNRLLMAVHEFAHLVMNEINPSAPVWLNEGIASYLGSPDGQYEKISKMVFQIVPEINFTELENSYYKLKAPDVYSYSAVAFIISEFGKDKLNCIIRNPEKVYSVLKTDQATFNRQWNNFIKKSYGKNV